MKKIILLRHGEVDIRNHENITSNQFEKWIIKYNHSDIKSEFSSKNEIEDLLNKTDILMCSSLKRSIQSVEIFDKVPFEIDDVFDEAELPSLNWSFLKFNPKVWLVFFRIVWFFGYSQNCESYKIAKSRAKKATQKLIELSKHNDTVLLVGHGIMNKLIKKELISEKYKEIKQVENHNWDYGVFELIKLK